MHFRHHHKILLVILLAGSLLGVFSSDGSPALAQAPTYEAGLNKEFSPIAIPMGGTSTLTVRIFNPNPFALTLSSSPPAWEDTLPSGVSFASPTNVSTNCGGTVTTIGSTLRLIGGTVPAQNAQGTPGQCFVSVDVTSVVPGNHVNSIPANTLNATDPTGESDASNPTPANATLTVEPVSAPGLSKSFSPNTVWVGQTSVLSIRINNADSNEALTGVNYTDILPSGVVVASPAQPATAQTGCGSPTVQGGGGSPIAPGDTTVAVSNATINPSSNCFIYVNVTSSSAASYSNLIPANTIQTDQGVTNNNAANAPLNVQAVSINKNFSPSSFQVGGTSTLTINLLNPSPDPYTDVSITDNLPTGLTVSTPPASTQCGGTVSYTSGSVTLTGGTIPGGSITTPGSCSIVVQVQSGVSSSYTNTIPPNSLTSAEGATNLLPATAQLAVYATGTGLTGSKNFGSSAIALGGRTYMDIFVRAPGDTDLTNFSISDLLPAGLIVDGVPNASKTSQCIGGTWAPAPGDTLLTYTGGTIQAGQQCRLRVYITSDTAGTFTNTISPANVSNNENRTFSSSISRSITVSGLDVTKEFFPDTVNSGGLSRLTITLINTGPEQIEGVNFVDTMPGTVSNGVVIAPTPNLVSTCPDAVVTALPGTQSIEMTGGVIPQQVLSVPGVCTVSVDVLGVGSEATRTNDINPGEVTGTVHGTTQVVSNPVRARDQLHISTIEISVSKGFSPVEVFGGATSTLTIRLSNPGEAPLSGISFTDNLPQRPPDGGMSIATPPQFSVGSCGGSIAGTAGDTSFTFSGGYLAAGAFCEITMQVTMDVENNLTNVIDPEAVTTNEGASNPDGAEATLTNLPGASVTKYFTPNPLDLSVSTTTTLTIEIQNTSNILMTGMGLADTLPAGMTVASTPVEDQCGGTVTATSDTITLADGTLDGLTSCTVEVEVTVSGAGEFENCIPVEALSSDQTATNQAETCDTLVAEAEVLPPSISKSFAPNPIAAGDNSVLTFTIVNPGENTVPLQGVAFTDNFPAGVQRYSVPNPSQCGGTVSSSLTSISLTGGQIAVDGSCTVVVVVTAAAGGSYENISEPVSSTNGGSGNTATDTLIVIDPPSISKEFAPDSFTAGGTSTLTVTISNPNADQTLTGVSVVDNLPTGVVVADPANASTLNCNASSTPTFNPSAGSSTLALSNASIAPGGDCEVSVDITAPNAGSYTNTTEPVQSANGGEGNTATDQLTVNGPGLSLVKSTTTTSYQAVGDAISYSYLLTNTGDVELFQPFAVSDDKATVSCPATPASLTTGETITCTATYNVQSADITAKFVTNTATATAEDDLGGTITSNSDDVTVPLAALRLQKSTPTLGYIEAGDEIDYDYVLTNVGSVTLYPPFQVTDDHIGSPPGTAFTCGAASSLPVGGNLSCSATYTVQEPSDVTNGSVTNIANASAEDFSGTTILSTPVDQSVTVYHVSPPQISKSFSPAVIAAGTTSTLTFTITNPDSNEIPLTGVSFVDNLPAGMTVATDPVSAQCGGSVTIQNSDQRIVFQNGAVLADSSCTVSVTVTVGTVGTYNNTSNVVTSANGGNGNTASDTLVALSPPTISKAFSPDLVIIDGVSTMTFTITNTNATTPITGVSFTDSFPAGIEVASPANTVVGSGCGYSSSPTFAPASEDTSLTFSNGSIDGGSTCTISVDVVGTSVGAHNNTTSQIQSVEGGTGAASNTATLTVVQPAISLVKSIASGDNYTAVGDTITYEYLLTNTGNVTLIGTGAAGLFEVDDDLVTVTCPATPAGLAPANSITCTASYTVVQEDIDAQSVTNVAITSAIYDETEIESEQDTQTATYGGTHNPLIELTKTGTVDPTVTGEPDVVDPGDVIDYVFTVVNTGNVTLTDITVEDTVGGVTVTGTTIASLGPSESDNTSYTGQYTIEQEDLDDLSFTNTATATGTPPEGEDVTDEDEEVTLLVESPLLGLAKRVTDGPTSVGVGTWQVTFEFYVENYGNVTLTDLQVSDDLTETFDAPTTFTVISLESDDFTVNWPGFDGETDTNLLDGSDSLGNGESGTITLVIELVPARGGYFYNTAFASATSPGDTPVTDTSQDGEDPDPSPADNDPTNNGDPTPVNFDFNLFDPPFGVKVLDETGAPELLWTMVWINDSNIVPLNATASDEIPEGTQFSDDGLDNGTSLPIGAPAGSVTTGVVCEDFSAITSTTYCYYEGPTIEYPRGRIVWEGSIGPDEGATDADDAEHEIYISFRVTVDGGVTGVDNVATLDADLNGDGDFDDGGEQLVAEATASWEYVPDELPPSGFPVGRVTALPPQPADKRYAAVGDFDLVIPKLGVAMPIVSVPVTEAGWDVTWLGGDAGYLEGSAFPTLAGNTVITAHVWDANNRPGPFARLGVLMYGDRIEVHTAGSVYTYEVREVRSVSESSIGYVFQHETLDWLTLFTCEGFDPLSGEYDGRRVVRAVLVSVTPAR